MAVGRVNESNNVKRSFTLVTKESEKPNVCPHVEDITTSLLQRYTCSPQTRQHPKISSASPSHIAICENHRA